MKRILLTIVAVALVITAFSGCGGGKTNEKLDVNLVLWHYYNGVQKEAFDKYVTEFNETAGRDKGIVIEAFSKSSVNGLADEVEKSAKMESLDAQPFPDMFLSYPDTAKTVDKLGKVAELDKYFTAAELNEYVDGFIEEGRLDASGKLKIFPTAKSTEILVLNKTDWDKFTASALEEFDVVLTYDNLKTIEGLVEVSDYYFQIYGKAFYGRDSMANYAIIGAKQMGVELFSIDAADNLVLDADEDVFRKLWENYYVPYIKGHFFVGTLYRSDDMKINDIIAATGSSTSAAYAEPIAMTIGGEYPVEYDFLPAPVFEGGENYNIQQGAGIAVAASDNENKIKGCVEFLKWFTEVERNIKYAVSSNYMPVKKSALDWEKIQEIIDRDEIIIDSNPEKDANAKRGLNVTVGIVKDTDMYCNKPFVNGNQARRVLDDAFAKSVLDPLRAQVLSYAATHDVTEAEALDALGLVSDQAFTTWYNGLLAALEAFKTPAV